jgi:hypothetical protein
LIALRILIVLIAGEGLFNILAHNFAVGEWGTLFFFLFELVADGGVFSSYSFIGGFIDQ